MTAGTEEAKHFPRVFSPPAESRPSDNSTESLPTPLSESKLDYSWEVATSIKSENFASTAETETSAMTEEVRLQTDMTIRHEAISKEDFEPRIEDEPIIVSMEGEAAGIFCLSVGAELSLMN